MKFSCPECQAKYQVDLPPPGDEGVEVKCARCEHTFSVFDEKPDAVATAAGNEEASGNAFYPPPTQSGPESLTNSDPGENLDAFLDDLIEQENTDTTQPDMSEQSAPADTSLDGMLDDLLTEDTPGEASSGMDDQALDQIWEDSVQQGQEEEQEEPPNTSQKTENMEEEVEAAASPPPVIDETPQEQSDPEPASANSEETLSEDELWNEAFADQAAEEARQSDPDKTTEDSAEPAAPEDNTASEPAPADDMENMSDEDAWAAAFADQEATETQQETGENEAKEEPAAETDMDNMSDEDAWAAAFADQEATESQQETGENETKEEPAAETDMDNMSEEDAWAAAFADQEATESEQKPDEGEASEETGGDSDEDLWAQAFADQEATEAQQQEEESEPKDEEGESEEDLWAKAFEDQAAVEGTQSKAAEEPAAEDSTDTSEEDLWEQAFDEAGGGDANASGAATEESGGTGEDSEGNAMGTEASDEEMAKLAALAHDEDAGPSLADEAMANYNEEDYADFDEDEFETETPRKKGGLFKLPSGKTGKLVVGGGILALLLIAGSAYFAIQTFAPPELVEEGQMAEADVDAESAEETSEAGNGAEGENEGDPETGEKTGPSAVEEAQNALLNEGTPETAPTTETPEEEPTPTPLSNALQPFADIVEMSTIMPVAYSPTDIKVLSFTIHLEMDQVRTAETVRDSLPVYEKIMVSTVESFLQRKFYNDILYVKEKLVKRLERAINKGLKQGKIKKAKFKDFQIS